MYIYRNANTQSISLPQTPHDVTRHDARFAFSWISRQPRYPAYRDDICTPLHEKHTLLIKTFPFPHVPPPINTFKLPKHP